VTDSVEARKAAEKRAGIIHQLKVLNPKPDDPSRDRPRKLITDVAAVVVPAAWMIADAIIRHGRSRAMLHQDPTR
jgi:hypothetical protein